MLKVIAKILAVTSSFFIFSYVAIAQPISISTVDEKELGEVTMTSGQATEFEVEVPEESFSVFIQAIGEKNLRYYFEKVENPLGENILGEVRGDIEVKENTVLNIFKKLKYSQNPSAGPVITEGAALMIPNRPEVKLLPGRWKFWIKAQEETFPEHKINLRSFIKSVQGPIDNQVYGVVPINLYFSGAGGLNSASYKTDPNFNYFYKTIQGLFATAGLLPQIQIAEDISFPKVLSASTPRQVDRDLIVKSPVPAPAEGVNIFFTSLRISGFEGVSFGLPGLIPRDDFKSGVIVGVPQDHIMTGVSPQTLQLKFQRAAYTAAHEIGHYLGLFHVCEGPSATDEDGLSDTKCETHSNLMMFGASNAPLSPQQRLILLRNPMVQLYRVSPEN